MKELRDMVLKLIAMSEPCFINLFVFLSSVVVLFKFGRIILDLINN